MEPTDDLTETLEGLIAQRQLLWDVVMPLLDKIKKADPKEQLALRQQVRPDWEKVRALTSKIKDMELSAATLIPKADPSTEGQQKDRTTSDTDHKTTPPVNTAVVNDDCDKPADSATDHPEMPPVETSASPWSPPDDPSNGALGDWNSTNTPAGRRKSGTTLAGDWDSANNPVPGDNGSADKEEAAEWRPFQPEPAWFISSITNKKPTRKNPQDPNADKVVAEKSNNIIRFVINLLSWMQKKGRPIGVPKQNLSRHWIIRFMIKVFGWMQKKGRSVEVSKQTLSQWCQHWIDLAPKSANASASAPDTASAPALVSSPPFAGPPPVAASASDAGNEKQSSVSFNDENDATMWKTAFIELTLGWARYCYQVNYVYQVKINQLTTKLANSSETCQEERTTANRLVDELHKERMGLIGIIEDTEARLRKILPEHVVNSWVKLFYSVFTNVPEVETKLVPTGDEW